MAKREIILQLNLNRFGFLRVIKCFVKTTLRSSAKGDIDSVVLDFLCSPESPFLSVT